MPVWRGSQITVREAISDYGISANNFGGSAIDTLVARIRGLNRPLLLSLRNTFRRRARTILTIATLAVGGATFMSAIFVGDSWYRTIEKSFEARHYDMEVRFSQPYPSDQVGKLVSAVPGVDKVETWAQLLTVRERADGKDGERFNVTGLPPTSDMLAFPVIEGRWLQPGDTNAVVINHELLLDPEANIKLGDHLVLRFGDKTSEWEVVGVVREVGAPRRGLGIAAAAYVPLDYLEKVSGIQGMTTNVRVRTSGHDDAFVTGVSQKLEQEFDAANMRRITIQLSTERKHVLEEHLVVIVAVLLVLAGLVAAVGGLGLASSMSINVMERAREIGVLRAIGASTWAIMQMVISEGLIIGLLSWVLAIVLAIPLSNVVGDFAGQIFIRAPLDHVYPLYAMAEWLGLALAISVVASAFPARSAARLTVREALAYE
jgi:putative ABC transport system permease protein